MLVLRGIMLQGFNGFLMMRVISPSSPRPAAGLIQGRGDSSVHRNTVRRRFTAPRESRFPDCPPMLYSFARFQPGSGRLVLVVVNFQMGASANGRARLPNELTFAAGLKGTVKINLILNRSGSTNSQVVSMEAGRLTDCLAPERFKHLQPRPLASATMGLPCRSTMLLSPRARMSSFRPIPDSFTRQ